MRRLHKVAIRLAVAGLSALSLGIVLVVASLAHSSGTPAFADTAPYEVFCPGTPVGNIALNGVVTTGTITPAAPASGSTFNLTNYQSTVQLPAAIVSAAAALGNSAITGTATLKVDATGATPATVAAPPITIDAPIPSPVPPTGLSLLLPSTPGTVGPFTASGGAITLTVDPAISLTLVVSGSDLNLTCTPYPNNAAATGIVATAPSAPKASPVIAAANGGSTTTTTGTPPPTPLTGPYELFCPGTPVGSIALNDAVTSATLSPASPSAGQSFSVTGYQTVVNLPAALASAAAAVSPGQPLAGSATAQIDASGATPATTPEGPLDFSVPIPSPVPDSGVSLTLPSTPATIPGFTATSGAITIQQDANASISLTVAGQALALTCTAYPNNTVTPSGITTSTPSGSPLAPVIAEAAGGSTATTSTTTLNTTTTTLNTTTTTVIATTTTSAAGTTSTTAAGGATPTTVASTTTTSAAHQPATSASSSTAPTRSTSGTNGSGGSGSSSQKAGVVTASSHSLAFTGAGPGLKTATVVGVAVIILGIILLLLADMPRRMLNQLSYASPWRRRNRSARVPRSIAMGPPVAIRERQTEPVFVDRSSGSTISPDGWTPDRSERDKDHHSPMSEILAFVRDHGVLPSDRVTDAGTPATSLSGPRSDQPGNLSEGSTEDDALQGEPQASAKPETTDQGGANVLLRDLRDLETRINDANIRLHKLVDETGD